MKLLKRISLVVIIGFGVMYAAGAQDGPNRQDPGKTPSAPANADSEKISFSIQNDTGFTIKNIFVCRVDSSDWGNNVLVNPLYKQGLYNKHSALITIEKPKDSNTLYNIRLVDKDGDSYAKYNQKLSENITIKVGISDFSMATKP